MQSKIDFIGAIHTKLDKLAMERFSLSSDQLLRNLLMKTIIALALACPSLVGNYQCLLEDELRKDNIEQRIENGVTIYQWNDLKIIADEKFHPLPDTPTNRDQNIKGTCLPNSILSIQTNGKSYDDSTQEFQGNYDISVEMEPLPQNGLQYKITGYLDSPKWGKLKINRAATCTVTSPVNF